MIEFFYWISRRHLLIESFLDLRLVYVEVLKYYEIIYFAGCDFRGFRNIYNFMGF